MCAVQCSIQLVAADRDLQRLSGAILCEVSPKCFATEVVKQDKARVHPL